MNKVVPAYTGDIVTDCLDWLAYAYGETEIVGFMKLHGNFDVSGHSKGTDRYGRVQPAVVLSGAYATRLKWEQFDLEWNQRILKPNGLSFLHTSSLLAGKRGSQYENWTEEKKFAVLSEAIEIIGNKVAFINSQIVYTADFERFAQQVPEAKEPFPSALVFALAMVFACAKKYAEESNITEAYSYTFESGETRQDELEIHAAFLDIAHNREIGKDFRVPNNGISWKPKPNYPPVQAADVIANLSYKEIYRDTYCPDEGSRSEFFLLRDYVSTKYIMSYDYNAMVTVWDRFQASKEQGK